MHAGYRMDHEDGRGSSAPRSAVGRNSFNATGTIRRPGRKWNHNLVETAIGWS